MFLFVYQYILHIFLLFGYHLDIICPGRNLKNDARSVRHVGRRGEKETELHLNHDVDIWQGWRPCYSNVDIEQGVPKEVPNRITCTRFRKIATLNKSAVPLSGRGTTKKNLTVFLDISVNSEAPLNYSIFIEKKENLFNI